MKKPKTVEIVLRVRVPSGMSATRARHEVSQAWYGEIYAATPDPRNPDRGDVDVSLFPKWGKARVVQAAAK